MGNFLSTCKRRENEICQEQSNSSKAVNTICLNDELLVTVIDIRHGLLFDLTKNNVLNERQVELIESHKTHSDQISQLLEDVRRQTDELQNEFISALDNNNQSHVANYIRNNGKRPRPDEFNWPLAACIKWSEIKKNRRQLVEQIDMNGYYGLLDKLYFEGCISNPEMEDIAYPAVTQDRIKKLLNCLKYKSMHVYNNFIDCLLRTGQQHVVSLMEPSFSSDDQTPLNFEQLDRLNNPQLIDLIDTTKTSLIEKLLHIGCITEYDCSQYRAGKTNAEVNGQLLNSIGRGRQLTLSKFILCLNRTGQSHVSDIILYGRGAVVAISAVTHSSKSDEKQLAEQVNQLIRESPDFKAKLFDLMHTYLRDDSTLVALRNGNSIKVFILCNSLIGLWNLHRIFHTRYIKTLVQQLLTLPIENKQSFDVVSHSWDVKDYTVCAQRLSDQMGLPKLSHVYQLALQTLDVLPDSSIFLSFEQFLPELKENLLFKAAGQLFVIGSKLTARADVYMFVMLSAVCRYWWETLKSRKYRKSCFKQYRERFFQPYRFDAELVRSIPAEVVVHGIAEFNGNLYVKRYMTSAIQVFAVNSNYDQPVYEITLPDVWTANIMVCSVTGYLFVVDHTPKATGDTSQNIWRVNLASGNYVVEEFIKTRCSVRNTSVHRGRLLVTPTYNDPKAIFHYNEDGQLRRRIRLPEDMSALYSIETANKTFVVSYTVDEQHPKRLHQVSIRELSDMGKVLREYSGAVLLTRPIYLSLDVNENILVVESRTSNQIILLNPYLELERVLLTIDVETPFHEVRYSHQTGNLYVCHRDRTDIYKLASFDPQTAVTLN